MLFDDYDRNKSFYYSVFRSSFNSSLTVGWRIYLRSVISCFLPLDFDTTLHQILNPGQIFSLVILMRRVTFFEITGPHKSPAMFLNNLSTWRYLSCDKTLGCDCNTVGPITITMVLKAIALELGIMSLPSSISHWVHRTLHWTWEPLHWLCSNNSKKTANFWIYWVTWT